MKRTTLQTIALVSTLALLVPAFPIKASAAALTDYNVRVYDGANGLPTSEANTVLSASDGTLWIGSYGGLVHYDATNFKNYSLLPEFGKSGIRMLAENDGVIWIGTNSDGVYSYDGETFTAYPTADGKNIPSVREIEVSSDGTVYVGTTGGVYTVSEGIVEHIVPEITTTVYSLSIDEKGTLWGVDGQGGLFSVNGTQYTYKTANSYGVESIYSVLADGNKVYLGDKKNRLVVVEGSTSTIYDTGSVSGINRILKAEDGKLWLASATGVCYFTKDMTLVMDDELLSCTSVNDIAIDYEDNVWLASTKYGLYEVVSSSFYHKTDALPVDDASVNAIVKANGFYYIGTDSGLVVLDKNYEISTSSDFTILNGKRIRGVTADRTGALWICAYDSEGLLTYQNGTLTPIPLPTKKVRNVLARQDGSVVVASDDGVFVVKNGALVRSYDQTNGLKMPYTLCLAERNGTLYAGTNGGGLYRLDETATCVDESLGVVLRILADESGLWVSSGNSLYHGLTEFNRVESFMQGIGSIFDLFTYEDSLCILKSDGVYLAEKNDLLTKESVKATHYGGESGMTNPIVANSFSLLDGDRLFVCTSNSFNLLTLADQSVSAKEYRTKISSVSYVVGGEEYFVKNTKNIVIPADATRVNIQFRCLHYGFEELTLSYYLDGFDRTPFTQTSKSGVATYTNLSGGTYSFKIKVENGEEVTLLTFEKTKAWYEVPAIVIFLVLIVAFVFFLLIQYIYRHRLERSEQQKAHYQTLTTESLRTIAKTIDAKDKYTNGHSLRVADYSRIIARRIGMSEGDVERLYYIALLHDIGKIGIPDQILNKPGRLTDEEYKIIQGHTTIGADILKEFSALEDIAVGALGHHERWDGKGYPNGKVGKENPLVARIISVADAYDAMSTNRPYREKQPLSYSISELEKGKGTQFDPELAEVFISYLKEQEL